MTAALLPLMQIQMNSKSVDPTTPPNMIIIIILTVTPPLPPNAEIAGLKSEYPNDQTPADLLPAPDTHGGPDYTFITRLLLD